MFPHLQIPFISMFGKSIPMVRIGLLLALTLGALWFSYLMRTHYSFDKKINAVAWSILGGAVGGHLFYLVAYTPAELVVHPTSLLFAWNDFSEVGVLGGGLLIGWLYFKRYGALTSFFEAFIPSVVLGMSIFRFGQYVSGKFLGVTLSQKFFLAIEANDGFIRHDYSLYLALSSLTLFLLFMYIRRRNMFTDIHQYLWLLFLWYGSSRLYLDFLRPWRGSAAEVRYFEFTPAQYVAVVVFVIGLVSLLDPTGTKRRWLVSRCRRLLKRSTKENLLLLL